MTVLVTGGAGYIGSHVALALLQTGERVAILDDLSTGSRESVNYLAKRFGSKQFSFEEISLSCGPQRLKPLLTSLGVESVVHLAGSVRVDESVQNPLLYYRNNVIYTHMLVDACMRAGIRRFVFSSSAAVYGNPATTPVSEDAPLAPVSPYGHSKAMAEQILLDAAGPEHLPPLRRWLSCVALRYFNVAGADPGGKLGYRLDTAPTHLIRRAIAVALGKKSHLEIFGTDYPTPDGTCVRDFVHVSDIAHAHVGALGYVRNGGGRSALNCGSGRGYSVLSVVEEVKKISGIDFEVSTGSPRPGDPAQVVADISRMQDRWQWQPKYDLADMVKHQLAWERKAA